MTQSPQQLMDELPPRISLSWLILAWRLFRARWPLWTAPALGLVIALAGSAALVTDRARPVVRAASAALHVPPGWDAPVRFGMVALLLAGAFAANNSMTAMANRAVRGESLGVRDLFQFAGGVKTAAVLLVTLGAVALGSLAFFVGALVAVALLLPAQSTAYRTRRVRAALRDAARAMRTDLARSVVLAAALIALIALGMATFGVGLLVAIPPAKLTGALADQFVEVWSTRFVEARAAAQPSARQGGGRSAELSPFLPASPAFVWTAQEERLLQETAPPLSARSLAAMGLALVLAGVLLLPMAPAANLSPAANPSLPAMAPPAVVTPDAAPVVTGEADTNSPGQPDAPADDPDAPSFVGGFVPGMPSQARWGDDLVRIEKVTPEDAPAYPQIQLTVLDRDSEPVCTVTDDGIAAVTPAPLLGDDAPELLIRTEEGGDPARGMDIILTQQGRVHDLVFLRNTLAVRVLAGSHDPEPIVVDAPIWWAVGQRQGGPILTTTYRWNGDAFENDVRSIPGPTQARMDACRDALLQPGAGSDPAQAAQDTIGLLANAQSLGIPSLPASVTASDGFRQGMAWLSARPDIESAMRTQVAQAGQDLPRVADKEITINSGQ